MKKLSPPVYRSLFMKHVWDFLHHVANFRELSGNHAVAVSGGLDSMTLLWFANDLHKQGKIGKVRALFVNHHTREGQSKEGEVVKKFCEKEGIPFLELHAEGLSTQKGNFEANARGARMDLFKNALQRGELLWQGHHLDDSYEWNFMQRHRSMSPKSTLGIPVRNRKIVRPFLCVSRAQLKKLSTLAGIPFIEDPTNRDLKYDRNFVRHEIIPLIKKRYPNYLKFYSHSANYSAMILKMSLLDKSDLPRRFDFETGAVLIGRNYPEILIQELLHHYSNTDRGEIMTTIQRMLAAIKNGKKGPFHFSGGMEAYYTYGVLMLYRQGMKNHDELFAEILSHHSKETLGMGPTCNWGEFEHAWQNLLESPDALMNLPGLVLVMESESICKTLNTSVFDPLFPKVSDLCKMKGLRFTTFQKCLDTWMQKKEKLPEKLRLVPLTTLLGE